MSQSYSELEGHFIDPIIPQQLEIPIATIVSFVGSALRGNELRIRIGEMRSSIEPVCFGPQSNEGITRKIVTLASSIATTVEWVQNSISEEAQEYYQQGLQAFEGLQDERSRKLLGLVFARNMMVGKAHRERQSREGESSLEVQRIKGKLTEAQLNTMSFVSVITHLLTGDILYPSPYPLRR